MQLRKIICAISTVRPAFCWLADAPVASWAEELLLLPGRPTVDLRVAVSPQNITAFASRATFVCGGLFRGRAMIHLYNSG